MSQKQKISENWEELVTQANASNGFLIQVHSHQSGEFVRASAQPASSDSAAMVDIGDGVNDVNLPGIGGVWGRSYDGSTTTCIVVVMLTP